MALAVLAAVPSAARAQSGYAGLVLHTPGLAGFWRLGETSGTVAGDAGGQAAGSYLGGPVLGARGALSADADAAARFDGVDDEMQTGGRGRCEHHGRGLVLLGGGRGADARFDVVGGWILAFDSGGRVAYRVAGTTFTTPLNTADVRAGWHHLALTVADGTTDFFSTARWCTAAPAPGTRRRGDALARDAQRRRPASTRAGAPTRSPSTPPPCRRRRSARTSRQDATCPTPWRPRAHRADGDARDSGASSSTGATSPTPISTATTSSAPRAQADRSRGSTPRA